MKPATKKQKGHRPYMKSGYYSKLKTMKGKGIAGIDKRTGPGKDALEFRANAVSDLGGDLATTKKALLDIATMERYLLHFGIAFILTLESPVNKRRRGFYPIVKDVVSLGDSLTKHLITLGLERVSKQLTLDEIFTQPQSEEP